MLVDFLKWRNFVANAQNLELHFQGDWFKPNKKYWFRRDQYYHLPAVLPCPCCGIASLALKVQYHKRGLDSYYEAYVSCNLFGCGTRGGSAKRGVYAFWYQEGGNTYKEIDKKATHTAVREAIRRWNRRTK